MFEFDEEALPQSEAIFTASLTDSATVGGELRYAWTEQAFDALTGTYTDAEPARSGTTTLNYATQINGVAVTPPALVWMRQKGIVGGKAVYEFDAAVAGDPGPDDDTSFLVIQEVVSGSSVIAAVVEIDWSSADGIAFTDVTPPAGAVTARIAQVPAGVNINTGGVTQQTQILGGCKIFRTGTSADGLFLNLYAIYLTPSTASPTAMRGMGVATINSTLTISGTTWPMVSMIAHPQDTDTNATFLDSYTWHTDLTAGGLANCAAGFWSGNDPFIGFGTMDAFTEASIGDGLRFWIRDSGVLYGGKWGTGGGGDTFKGGICTALGVPASGSAPATASSTGTAGRIAYDSSYLYICTGTNTWKRVAIATW